jgi:hypothetical protein
MWQWQGNLNNFFTPVSEFAAAVADDIALPPHKFI